MNSWALRGIIPPVITPLRGDDLLDEAGLEKLIEYLLAGGVSGLFVSGTTGEGPALSYHTRRAMIRRTAALVAGRVPVLAGLLDSAYPEMIALARYAAEVGADAVVGAPPCYFPLSQDDIFEFTQRLAAESPLPVLLYNTPHSSVRFELDTLERIADLPGIHGLKDSNGDPKYLEQLLRWKRTRADFSVYVGPEEFLASALRSGADGGVSGGANLFPKLYANWYKACAQDDTARIEALSKQVQQVWASIYTVGDSHSSIVRGLKCGLSLLGICDDHLATPYCPATRDERSRVREFVERFLQENGEPCPSIKQ